MDDPIKMNETLGEKLNRITKIIFRRLKKEDYFVRPYELDSNITYDMKENWKKLNSAFMATGKSAEEFSYALTQFSRNIK